MIRCQVISEPANYQCKFDRGHPGYHSFNVIACEDCGHDHVVEDGCTPPAAEGNCPEPEPQGWTARMTQAEARLEKLEEWSHEPQSVVSFDVFQETVKGLTARIDHLSLEAPKGAK